MLVLRHAFLKIMEVYGVYAPQVGGFRHDIDEILWKEALNTINLTLNIMLYMYKLSNLLQCELFVNKVREYRRDNP